MKRLFCAFALGMPLLTFNAAMAASLPTPRNSFETINAIVAVVNKDIITQEELSLAMRAAKEQIRMNGAHIESEKKLREQVIEGLILQKLQLQLAKQNNITATAAQVDDAIGKIAQQNHVPMSQLQAKLKEQGIDYMQFRAQIKEQIIMSTLQQQAVSADIRTTPAEFDEFKKQLQQQSASTNYHIVDYLVSVSNEKEKDSALQNAKNVAERLRSNKNVTTGNGVQVNDLAMRPLKELPDLFATTVVNMSEGSVSNPLLAGNGYHILKLVNTKAEPLAINEQQIQQLFMQSKFQQAVKKWLEKLRTGAYIKVYEN